MPLFVEIVIGFIVAVIAYNLIHYFFITRPIDKGHNETLKILNGLVNNLLENQKNEIVEVHDLSNVWGRNIYVFEYVISQCQTDELNDELINKIKDEINEANESKMFNHEVVLTDSFVRENQVHVDLAYLLNAATYEYVLDMRQLNKVN
ncbi:hypothetical protein ERK14_05505 [Lactobacillus kunkeei]|uniref:Uncharacterized protein n=1 Tax=Apilactobacillus nanyangensis TaxID=2799579 RepID=A0ABT0HW42_9LACO|nr:hypothetical protein [Apilactobacillus nanyangensis]MBC6388993.1 hypothetical protein [Apilactobacillus kunkeei]MCK8611155.1 hypothetical protein [Apilactobacillus nanyangensis]TMT00229.1 hypothetical protein FD687_05395 [Apilactobacillus kunkeei]TMT03363.1 hypothetical protein FD689_05490 [Apilactobacillus kunkeei]CAI2684522.1 hypothetical protein AKUA1404_09900 [Apilactobacillus kunkeei]